MDARIDKPMVLIVEPETRERDRISAWLVAAGNDVMTCPGPSAPDYTCMAGRGEACPLARRADVVVLDLELDSEVLGEGTTATELLTYYVGEGKPVVALSSSPGPAELFPGAVTNLPRPPRAEALVDAVRDAAS